jgi:hypothetical protein
MVDETTTDNLLHTISGNLYFNNELLAKANDIQDIADWALYPALQDVNIDGKQLLDVLNITPVNITDNLASQGTAGQYLHKSSDENKMVWGDLPEPPVSVSSINSLSGSLTLTSVDSSININSVDQNINLSVLYPPPPVAVNSLNLLTGDLALTSTGNTIIITKVDGININLETATPPPAGVPPAVPACPPKN